MRLFERLRSMTATPDADEAVELRTRADELGVDLIGDTVDRTVVEVCGVARSTTHPPVGSGPPAQVVQLFDGSGDLDVVWLGRRAIPGIRPGVYLRVRGRVQVPPRRRVMYNPAYEIIPGLV